MFRDGTSLFTPNDQIGTADNLDDLYERFVRHPDESKRRFIEKPEDQLAGAGRETIQLMAEMLFGQLLTPAGIGRNKKLSLVSTVLSWSPEEVLFPEALEDAFSNGVVNDMSFMQQRPFHLTFMLEVIREWNALDVDRRETRLAGPWEFKEFLHELPIHAAQPMREILCCFVHIEYFEPISSRRHKIDIVEAFRDLFS